MNNKQYPKTSWPTEEQLLLLKALILQGDDAINAWLKWKSIVDFNLIDAGSYRLLPMLYYNLQSHGIKDPLMNRLKGVYRRTWYENQMLSQKCLNLLEQLHKAGIRTIILKGIGLLQDYYKDYGVRPMRDFDILVPTGYAVKAIKIIQRLGWVSAYKSPESIVHYIHSTDFTDASGLYHLDLHWHLFIECCQSDSDKDFWDGAAETLIKNIHTQVLNPADQLLHTIIHGIKWSIIPPFRWMADAVTILNISKEEIDWKRLLEQARKRKLTLPLRRGLEFLVNNFDTPVDNKFLKALQEIPLSRAERFEFKYKTENQKSSILGNIPVLWFDSMRLNEDRSLRHKISGFINYIRRFWDLESISQLPGQVLKYAINKLNSKLQELILKKGFILLIEYLICLSSIYNCSYSNYL